MERADLSVSWLASTSIRRLMCFLCTRQTSPWCTTGKASRQRKNESGGRADQMWSTWVRGTQSNTMPHELVGCSIDFCSETFYLFMFNHGRIENTRNNKNYIHVCRPPSDDYKYRREPKARHSHRPSHIFYHVIRRKSFFMTRWEDNQQH